MKTNIQRDIRDSEVRFQNNVQDVTALFAKCGIETGAIQILEHPGMYPHKEEIECNWSYYTIAAFKKLQKLALDNGTAIHSIAIIGIGSGVEGIAAARIFSDTLETLTVSDIVEDITRGAERNIAPYLTNTALTVHCITGSLCEPFEQHDYRADLVFANIPNLPSDSDEIADSGAERGTFFSPSALGNIQVPLQFTRWALGCQYAYLQSAKQIISNNNAQVITELGGRVPSSILKELFTACGYFVSEIVVGFKEQSEPLIDFIGYHAFEKQYGVSFDFYLVTEARRILSELAFSNPTDEWTADEIKQQLLTCRVSAGEAIDLFHKNIKVGHIVQVLAGKCHQ